MVMVMVIKNIKMFVFDGLNKQKINQIVESNLKKFGVKHRKIITNAIKTKKPGTSGGFSKKIFKTSLSALSLTLVNLSSGATVHVPIFVSQASSFLLKDIDLEGLFRKAGSKSRQKEMIIRLDSGGAFGDEDHGIDVANCLKTFFRDLPEPLIPYAYHDLFIRCVMLKKNRIEALLSACLMLPPQHLKTVAFLMDFLQKVATYEQLNKMGAANLATVIGPNIMPLKETSMVAVQSRLEKHLTVVQLLIENAEKIGILPNHVAESKKKHRSGSLTRKTHLSASNINLRMLSGLKKIVGKNNSPLDIEPVSDSSNSCCLCTPLLKIGKKRKVTETAMNENSNKKKTFEQTEKTKKMRFSFDRFVSRSRPKTAEAKSASKIGIKRRRSQEKPVISKRVNRTASWHVTDIRDSNSLRAETTVKVNNLYSNTNLHNITNRTDYPKSKKTGRNSMGEGTFCSKETNERLDILQDHLTTLPTHTAKHTKGSLSDSIDDQVFQPGTNKITDFIFEEKIKELNKSNSHQNIIFNSEPFVAENVPSEGYDKVISWKDAEKYFRSEGQTATPVPVTGRPSVHKLRTQNVGMVLAKAKLFGETKKTFNHSKVLTERKIIQNQDVNPNKSATGLKQIKSLDLDVTESPRRQVHRKKNISPKNNSAKIRITKTSSASPVIKMEELTIVPRQETPQNRKHRDNKCTPSYQNEDKSMKTPPSRKNSAIYQESNLESPLNKKPLSVKTPTSAKSLARRPAVEVRRTHLKAIGPLGIPRRQSPRSILKSTHLSSRRFS